MSALPKKKLCWNCEGRVAYSDENCTYCGVYLSSSSLINQNDESSTHIAPLAPYRPKKEDTSIPHASFKNNFNEESGDSDQDELEDMTPEAENSQHSGLLPFCLLLSGSIFFIFGLILFIFSRQGMLTLQWDASYWFLYLGVAAILLFLGWRSMRTLSS